MSVRGFLEVQAPSVGVLSGARQVGLDVYSELSLVLRSTFMDMADGENATGTG
jgi:hypothetical protein